MEWGKAVEALAHAVAALGPYGTIVVSLVVGLAIVVVLVANFSGLYADRRAGAQSLDFVDRLIGEVDKLAQRELVLRADLERRDREDEERRLRYITLQADVDLMRVQLRRTIETLRQVKDGHLKPDAITDEDIAAEALK